MQANLINIHVPRGKARVTQKRVRGRQKVKKTGVLAWARRLINRQDQQLTPLPPLGPVKRGDKEAARKQLRERSRLVALRDIERDKAEFWNSATGRKVEAQLDEIDPFWQTEEGLRMAEQLDEE